MANKSSKSPSGEDREQKNEFIRRQEVEGKDIADNTGEPKAGVPRGKQETLSNRGYDEDQPDNPVRGTGSMRKDQESLPTGEPDKEEKVMKNNQTGPGLG